MYMNFLDKKNGCLFHLVLSYFRLVLNYNKSVGALHTEIQ